MNKIYNISVKSDYILITANGNYSQSVTKNLFLDAVDAAKTNKIFKILIDCREVIGEISTLDRYDIGVLLSQLVYVKAEGKIIKVAFVAYEPIIDPKRFVEKVAVNRGADVKAFTNYEEAIEWLGIQSQ